MHKKLTISIEEDVYYGLIQVIGQRKISQFIEDLARPYVLKDDLNAAYRAMANDEKREEAAMEWIEGLTGDVNHDER